MAKNPSHPLMFFRLSGRSAELSRLEGLAQAKRRRSANQASSKHANACRDLRMEESSATGALSAQPARSLANRIRKAGLSLSPTLFILGALALATAFGAGSLFFVNPIFIPVFFLAGLLIPLVWLNKRIAERAARFALDYPAILLATASSVKVGMTPYQALKRSIQVLPRDSAVRLEVQVLLGNLDAGMRREDAINLFAADYDLPELDLFRAALLLSLEHGGHFAPTLHRLALVSRDRLTLIHQAKVNTATMRMTANIVLGLVPFVLITLSSRTPDYWHTLQENDLANVMATIGLIILGLSYSVLRHMSNFRP